jgi:hypothetical protein
LACAVGCICASYEETPCNATINLLIKIISVLRLFVAISAFLKVDHQTSWEWSTTFWPYWCSFAIQAIIGIASFVIFANTILNYARQEAIIEDSKHFIIKKFSLGSPLGIYSDFWVCDLDPSANHQYHLIL